MSRCTGVLWAGPLYDRGGYGNVSRNFVRALLAAGIPVRTAVIGDYHKEIDSSVVNVIKGLEGTGLGSSPVGIFHWTPDMLCRYRFKGISALILDTIFETHSIPSDWADVCNHVSQVWVPSRFNLETFCSAGVKHDKLRAVPYPVDCEFFRPGIPRRAIQGAKGFIFLYVFVFGWRKGFDILLRAYGREFRYSDPVTLVLKVVGNGRKDIRAEILRSALPDYDPGAPGAPRVIVISEPIDQTALRDLYASCDLYISTDRANGWGMPCMEAMAMGKAAATVDWSGSTEFMTKENALLIRPERYLEPVHQLLVNERGKLYRDQMWAVVRVEEVQRIMRLAYEDRDLLRRIGERAAQEIRSRFNFESVGRIMRQRLDDLGNLPTVSESPQIVQKFIYRFGDSVVRCSSAFRKSLLR